VEKLEQMLTNKEYLTGHDFTVADVAYFNEMTNVLNVLGEEID